MARNQRDPMFKQRHFDDEIILLCVRWYISYKLSYRDLSEMMLERDLAMAPSTIYRWVQHYVPEFEKRWNRFSRSVGTSWRVDEIYVNIKGQWHYLHGAVDKPGRTINFYLSRTRGIAAAKAFFQKALATNSGHRPSKVTLDGHQPSHRALRLLRREHATWRRVKVRVFKTWGSNRTEP